MGKPIAGRDKFPFGITGIVVAGAKLADGTASTDLRISKQRSVVRFDLQDATGASLYSKLLITSKDSSGVELDFTKSDSELSASLLPGTFYVRAVNEDDVQKGLVVRFQLNKVVVSDGTSVFDMDFSKGTDGAVVVTGITLNKSTSAIKVGATETLVPTIAPANASVKTVAWSTSAASIATVSASGVVTAVANGSATITATSTDGAKTASCVYTVTTAVVSITATPATASIAVAGTQQISQTFSPTTASNKNVTYTSSAPAVATVNSSGLVTGVSAGSATITVTTQDGSKTSTSVITVTA